MMFLSSCAPLSENSLRQRCEIADVFESEIERCCTQYLDVYQFIFFFVFRWIGYQSNLEEMQAVLNSTEVSLHHLTALVDCRSLHMVRVLI